MSAQMRRRVIYVRDAEWRWAKEEAERRQVTVSSLVRAALTWFGRNDEEMRSVGIAAQQIEDHDDHDNE
jgi:hypothetical protein